MTDSKTKEISMSDLFKSQIDDNNYFRRMDIIVKYMALHDILNSDGDGLDYYRKMYNKLCRTSKKKINDRIKNLTRLSTMMSDGLFDTSKHPVILTPRGSIWDGAHRVSCLCYFDCKNVYTKRTNREFRRGNDLGDRWLKRVFSKEEIKVINEQRQKLFDKLEIEL